MTLHTKREWELSKIVSGETIEYNSLNRVNVGHKECEKISTWWNGIYRYRMEDGFKKDRNTTMHKYYVDLLYKWKSKQHLYQTQPVYMLCYLHLQRGSSGLMVTSIIHCNIWWYTIHYIVLRLQRVSSGLMVTRWPGGRAWGHQGHLQPTSPSRGGFSTNL